MSDFTIDPKDFKYALRMVLLIALLVAAAQLAGVIWPEQQAAQQPFYYPDPTPQMIIDQHTEVNIFSGNKFFSDNDVCIGGCE